MTDTPIYEQVRQMTVERERGGHRADYKAWFVPRAASGSGFDSEPSWPRDSDPTPRDAGRHRRPD